MIVRNPDARLRGLQRAAAEGGPMEKERFYREAARTGDCELLGEALFELGPEHALKVLGVRPGTDRDTKAVCLGLHLVQLGFLPNLPVVHFGGFGWGGGQNTSMKETKPKWLPLPPSVPGRARRRRFFARYGFSYERSWGHEEGVDRQSPTFEFSIDQAGKNWHAAVYARSLGDLARRIAPRVQFLARWNNSSAFTRSWANGERLDVAGGIGSYWITNNVYWWGRSDPARPMGRYDSSGDTPDASWTYFLRGSRAGYIPGDEAPPRPPHPRWGAPEVEAWLRDPVRNDKIRALFYADLWLARLLVPGSEVKYDPLTGGPKVQSNPMPRRICQPYLEEQRKQIRGNPWKRNMSRLSGPAVEDKGLLQIFEPYWSKIRSVTASSLGKPSRGFVPDLRDESGLLGCGAWGCVWRTNDRRFALKVTLDATEGPVIAQIMAKKSLRMNPGCVYFHRIWQLPELVRTNAYGYAPAYVILREEVAPVDWLDSNGDIRRNLVKIHDDLEGLPAACCALISARCDLEWCKTVECADAYVDAEKEFMGHVFDLRDTQARNVGTFMAQAYEAGILLGDVHPGNVGVRKHNLGKFGVPTHKQMVITDVGDEGQGVCGEDMHPRIRTLRNMPPAACHPRDPEVMAYWISRIPVL